MKSFLAGRKSFSKILLLGAGFSKNFGGFLGNEMWSRLFNSEIVQRSSHIRELMKESVRNYEDAYQKIVQRKEGVSDAESRAFEAC